MNGTTVGKKINFASACEGGGACVEVGRIEAIGIRDSKDPDGHVLIFDATEWRDFVTAVKAGEFDFG